MAISLESLRRCNGRVVCGAYMVRYNRARIYARLESVGTTEGDSWADIVIV